MVDYVLLSVRRINVDSGYYAACAGLQTQTQALELIANNLANLNTTGYRGQLPMFREMLAAGVGSADPLNQAINDFSVLSGSLTDMTPGTLDRTGNPLDVAIEGKGFFVVQTPTGTQYTRNGNFQMSTSGKLLTAAGDPVLGEDGAVTVPAGDLSISSDGTLSISGAVSGQLRIVEFVPGTAPVAMGNSYYAAPATAVRPSPNSRARQGMLEASNVNSVSAVVNLLMVQRRAEMLEQAMGAFHSNFDKVAANDLPKV
jgi:flagellar basal-body rod protein FlgF